MPRDLAPAVYAAGRLYVAPADYDRLLCLDPETGRLIWEREGITVVHLLGVGSGRLIFTTPRGIRAVSAADGGDAGGWQRPEYADHEGLPSYGRGFLAGEVIGDVLAAREAIAERHREALFQPVLRVEVEGVAEHHGDGVFGIAQGDAAAARRLAVRHEVERGLGGAHLVERHARHVQRLREMRHHLFAMLALQ